MYLGYEPVFFLHNVLITNGRNAPNGIHMCTVGQHNPTNIGLLGLRKKLRSGGTVFISATLNGMIPQAKVSLKKS